MAIGKIKASRVNNVDANTYIGEDGILFYNYANGVVRISDGITPGGVSIPYTVASNTVIGGIKAGPGVVISNEGELYIDSANLAFSFGNFTANNNILTIVNTDEDMILETSGNAEIQLVGNVGFYRTNGGGVPDPSALFFFARDDGQLRIFVPAEDPLEGGVEIIGSATGNYVTPGAVGTMLQLTGNPDIPCRLYHDSLGEYSSYVARRYNGTTASPGQVLAGEDVFRINTTAATDAGLGNVAMCQIRFTALEDQTTTAQGSEISFYVTAIGSPAANRVEVATITVADGITATKFTTAGTVTATGNITGGNILTAGLISATGNITGGNLNLTGTASVTGNVTTSGTFVGNISGLVTHRVRDAGAVGGTTLTLDVTSNDLVHCTFTDNFTVAFSNIIPGRVVTLIATNTSGGDSDIITAGISAVNVQGDSTLTVTQQTTAVVTYYSTGTTTGDIFASTSYA